MVGFILVSEPEDEELDCEEVGVAKIDLRELIKAREDLVEKPVDVFRSGHKLNLHSFPSFCRVPKRNPSSSVCSPKQFIMGLPCPLTLIISQFAPS